MGHFGLFELVLFPILYGVVLLGGIALAFSVVWAIWRMTWAHEKLERHVAEIERIMATRTGQPEAFDVGSVRHR